MKTFTAIVHQEGRWFVATCAEIGTTSQGRSMQQALKNLQEATELYLEEFPISAKKSIVTTFELAHA
jgi:predicted RNase H-like HicB family nuclease